MSRSRPSRRGAATQRRPSRRPRRLHEQELVHVYRATEFSDDPDLQDPVWLVRELKQHPQLLGPLEEMLTPAPARDQFAAPGRRTRGRPRLKGSWLLVYLAFVISRDPAMESFWQRWRDSALWWEAGFECVPDYDTLRLRFVELEKLEAGRGERGEKTAFRHIADLLISQARRHEPRIGQVIHVDGTAWQTHARLEHVCPDPAKCSQLSRAAKLITRASDEEVQEHRHSEAAGPEPAEGELPDGAAPTAGEDERFKYVWIGGHRYRTRDKTAGARMHGQGRKATKRRRKKFWLGGILLAGVDHFLGAPLAVSNIAADEHEHLAYPSLMEEIIEATGGRPLAMTGDKGQSIKSVFEFNTTRGIASVLPWRKPRFNVTRDQMRRDAYDEHGIPRCRYCGGPSQLESAGLGFYLDARKTPRLRFRCLLRHTAECEKAQSIACSEEWRLLVPINRLTSYYHDVRKSHEHCERIFRHWRDRYGVAGKNADTRLKRPGLPFQQLRASAALAIEWFRICMRYGWLGSARRRDYGELRKVDGAKRLRSVLRARKMQGLALPYGPAAVKLGLARAGPAP